MQFITMTMTSKNDLAEIRDIKAAATEQETQPAAGRANAPERAPSIWVLCRRKAGGAVETLRAFDDEARARADLELAETVSAEEFWVAAVPMIVTRPAESRSAPEDTLTRVQALALTWLAQGAEADTPMPVDDPVVVSPRHVRGFVSVPPHEWREMEDRGWVRDGLITPAGALAAGVDAPRVPGGEDAE